MQMNDSSMDSARPTHANLGSRDVTQRKPGHDDQRLAVELDPPDELKTRPDSNKQELRFPDGYVWGVSEQTILLHNQIRSVAGSDIPILLVGETGVGKEIYARALHLSSPRASAPFVAINCAAIPADLLEAELFGIARNVATGVAQKQGKFSLAQGGTLFLDEVAEMPPALQVKLLRVLQEREIQPVGGEVVEINLRILAATNVNLTEKLNAGLFRRDLFYRLAGFVMRVPPLRQRRADIPRLVEHFLRRFSADSCKAIRGLSVRALETLCQCSWPGNVRQLEHEIQRLVCLCQPGDVIHSSMLSEETLLTTRTGRDDLPKPCSESESLPTLNLAELEKRALQEALRVSRGRQAEAAQRLGISRFALRRRMDRFNL